MANLKTTELLSHVLDGVHISIMDLSFHRLFISKVRALHAGLLLFCQFECWDTNYLVPKPPRVVPSQLRFNHGPYFSGDHRLEKLACLS